MFLQVSVILFTRGGGVLSQHALRVVSQHALQQGGGCLLRRGLLQGGWVPAPGGHAPGGVPAPGGACSWGGAPALGGGVWRLP